MNVMDLALTALRGLIGNGNNQYTQNNATIGDRARGSNTALPPSSDDPTPGGKYFYHATSVDNLDSIAESGLTVPDTHSTPVSLSPHLDSAHTWNGMLGSDKTVLLRMSRRGIRDTYAGDPIEEYDDDGNENPEYDPENPDRTTEYDPFDPSAELATFRDIEPEKLDVYLNGKWEPLQGLVRRGAAAKSDFISETGQEMTPEEISRLSLLMLKSIRTNIGNGNNQYTQNGGAIKRYHGDTSPEQETPRHVGVASREIERALGRVSRDDLQVYKKADGLDVHVRHWGNWVTPRDAEDDEDYDWQEPTPETMAQAQKIADKIAKNYDVNVEVVNQGEKNWLMFAITDAKKPRTAIGNGNNQYTADNPTKGELKGAFTARDKAIINRPSSDYPPKRADGLDSREKFSDGHGNYTPERQELHRAIINKYLADTTPVEAPTTIFLGGGPASGKTTLVNEQSIGAENTVHLDVDKIRAELPEYKEGVARKEKGASSVVHEEASDIGSQLMRAAAAKSHNLLVDGTGNSSIEKLGGKIALMRSAGQTVIGKYCTLSADLAVQLAEARGQKTGRFVPESFIRAAHAAVSGTLPEAIKQGLFDRVDLYDTSVKDKAKPVISARGKDLVVHDQALWDNFLAKRNK